MQRIAAICFLLLLAVPALPPIEAGVSLTMTDNAHKEYAENFEPAGSAGQSSACCAAGVPPSDSFYTMNVAGTGNQLVVATAATGSTQAWQATDTSAPYVAQLVNTAAGVNLCTSPQSLDFDFNVPALSSALSVLEYRMSAAAAVTAAQPANSFGISITKVGVGTGDLYAFYVHGNAAASVTTGTNALATGLHHLKVSSVTCTSPAAATFQLDALAPVTVATGSDTLAGTYNRVGFGNVGSVPTTVSMLLDNYDLKFAPLPAPTITSVSPNIGQQGTGYLIQGTGFAPTATVSFGGSVASVTGISPTQITGTAPTHAVGFVSVTVTNPDGQSATLANAFQYTPPTFSGYCPSNPPQPLGENFGTFNPGATPARCWYDWTQQGLDSAQVATDTYLPQQFFPVGNTGTTSGGATDDVQSMKVTDASPGAMYYTINRGWNACEQTGGSVLHTFATGFRIDSATNAKLQIGMVDNTLISSTNPGGTDSKAKGYVELAIGSVPTIHLKGLAGSDVTSTASGPAIQANTWYTIQAEFGCRSRTHVPLGVPDAAYQFNFGINDLSGARLNDGLAVGLGASRPANSVFVGTIFLSNQAVAGGASSMTYHQDGLVVNVVPLVDRTLDITEGIKGWETSRDDTTVQIVRSSSANCNGVTDGNGNSYTYHPNPTSCQKVTTYNNQFTVIGGPDQAEFCGSQFYGVAAQKQAVAVVATNCGDSGELDVQLRSPYGNGGSNPPNQLSNPPVGINGVGSQNFDQSTVVSKICLVGTGKGCGPDSGADPKSGSQCIPCNPLEIGPMASAPWDYSEVHQTSSNYCGVNEGEATAVTTGIAFGMTGGVGAFALTQRGCASGDVQFSNYVQQPFGSSSAIPSQICTWSWPGRNPSLQQGGSSAGAIDWIAAAEPGYGVSVWQLDISYEYQNRGDNGLSSEPEAFVKFARRYDFTNPLLTDANSVACAADKMLIGTQTHGMFMVQPFNEPGRPAAGTIYGTPLPGSATGEPIRGSAIAPGGEFASYSTGTFLFVVQMHDTTPQVIGAAYDPTTALGSLPFNTYRLDAQANYIFAQDGTRLYRMPISLITHNGTYTPDPNPDDNTHCYGSTDGSGVPDCWNPCPGQHTNVNATTGTFSCPDGSTWDTNVLKSCATNPDQEECTKAAEKQACDIDPNSDACKAQTEHNETLHPTPGQIGGIFGGAAEGFGILGGSKESGGVWVCILLILALMAIGASIIPGKGAVNLLGAGVGAVLGLILCIITNLLSPIIVFSLVLLAGVLAYFKFFRGGGEDS